MYIQIIKVFPTLFQIFLGEEPFPQIIIKFTKNTFTTVKHNTITKQY